MNLLTTSRTLGFLALCSMIFIVGCGDSQVASDSTAQVAESEHGHDEHGHDEHGEEEHGEDEHEPKTFEEAFEVLISMKAKICAAFAAGTPDNAHDSLHKVGRLLEDLPGLAAKVDGISTEQTSKVEAAVEKLFDGFGALDNTMHDGPEVDVAELEKQLTVALGELEKAVQ